MSTFDKRAWATNHAVLTRARDEAHARYAMAQDEVIASLAFMVLNTGGESAADALARKDLPAGDFAARDVKGTAYWVVWPGAPIEMINLPEVGPLTFINVESTDLSAIACTVQQTEGRLIFVIYVRFKGGAYYRYYPHTVADWLGLVRVADMVAHEQPGFSLGSYYHTNIRLMHEGGATTCERLDQVAGKPGEATVPMWVNVLRKSEKPQTPKKKGKDERKGAGKKAEAKKLPTGPETPGEGTAGDDKQAETGPAQPTQPAEGQAAETSPAAATEEAPLPGDGIRDGGEPYTDEELAPAKATIQVADSDTAGQLLNQTLANPVEPTHPTPTPGPVIDPGAERQTLVVDETMNIISGPVDEEF